MKILDLNLIANQPHQIGRGRYVRLLDADGKIEIMTQTLGDKANQNGELIENVGAEFFKFENATVVSEINQKVVIAVSELPIYDNRVGNNSSAALITKPELPNKFVTTPELPNKFVTTPELPSEFSVREVLPEKCNIYEISIYKDEAHARANNDSDEMWLFGYDAKRKKAVIYFDEPVFLFTAKGLAKIPVPRGYFEFESVSGLRAEKQNKFDNTVLKAKVMEYKRA